MKLRLSSVVVAVVACLGCSPAVGAGSAPAAPPSPALEAPPEPEPEPEPAPEVAAVGGFDHVGLTVSNLEASQAMFVDVLGYQLRGTDPSYPAAFLSNGASFVTLWRAEDPEQAVAFNRRRNVGLHHMALQVSSFEALEQLHEALVATPGVVIEFPPELAYGGPAKHMMIREPSGNRIELIHRPPR
ncbi:MAG: VOC family protein [Myxococcota bacterium]